MSFELGTARVKSIKNLTSDNDTTSTDSTCAKDPKLFEESFPAACLQLCGSRPVFVRKEVIDEDAYIRYFDIDGMKAKKSVAKKRTKLPGSSRNESGSLNILDNRSITYSFGENVIIITARYDSVERLRELIIGPSEMADDLTMSVLTLFTPYYPNLRKIALKKIGVSPQTIYLMNKVLKSSNLTEICFNDLRLREANYYVLLDTATTLKTLSLCRCRINDEACKELFVRLEYSKPAEHNLCWIDLTSNEITDVGAQCIANTLRTNRHLRYINLSGNNVGDEGAISIFGTLMEFLLTDQEVEEKHARFIKYLQNQVRRYFQRRDVSIKQDLPHLDEKRRFQNKKAFKPPKKRGLKSKSLEDLEVKRSGEGILSGSEGKSVMGPIYDPFYGAYMKFVNNQFYCSGNFALAAINLAYNNMTYFSIKKLADVCLYQNKYCPEQMGLSRVVVEGNKIPIKCEDLILIENHMKKSILSKVSNN